jgi:hypothetical protein
MSVETLTYVALGARLKISREACVYRKNLNPTIMVMKSAQDGK